MEWLSVKKYLPPGGFIECILIANNSLYLGSWESETNQWAESDGSGYIKNVTHFMIPDSVEIEKD